MKTTITAAVAIVLLAGCASSGSSTVPYPNGPWSAGDQGTFMGACTNETSDTYCKCALGDVMQQHPSTSDLPGSILTGGTTAAEHKGDFPDCAGK